MKNVSQQNLLLNMQRMYLCFQQLISGSLVSYNDISRQLDDRKITNQIL